MFTSAGSMARPIFVTGTRLRRGTMDAMTLLNILFGTQAATLPSALGDRS